MDIMNIVLTIFAFILGAVIGSFLNVLIYRLPENMSIVKPGSHCFSCGEPIKWYDNIPIFSYLILRGKCRHCKASFSAQYCLIELFTGILYALIYIKYGYNLMTLVMFTVVSCLIVVFFIDLKHFIIPDSMIITILIASIASFFLKSDVLAVSTLDKFLSIALVVLIFLAIFIGEKICKKELMGRGDIKLFFVIGLLLGIKILFLGIFFAACIALIAELIFRKSKRQVIPFGPYLSLSFTLMIFFGSDIINWYMQLFQF